MAYEKQVWECGDVVTAEKLNHMEDGIESASESGGGTPSIIKIATVRGGGNMLARASGNNSQTWELAGGGSLDDDKTLAEILGGKTIVSLAFDIEGPSSTIGFYVKGAFVQLGSNAGKDILIAQFDAEASTSKNVSVYMTGFGDTPPNGNAIDIYAICI